MLTPLDSPALAYKQQLAKRFDRAAVSYDAYADFQKIVLRRLFTMLPVGAAEVVLDLGTGTGQALSRLSDQLSPSCLLALDLSPKMLDVARRSSSARHATHYVCADAEQLPFRSMSCDLVFSSLAVQWCLHPKGLFEALYEVTKPGGYLVFSTLAEGSMPEIRQAWRTLDDQEHVHRYLPMTELLACVKRAGWNLLASELSDIKMPFDCPESAIHSLKKVGASFIAPDGGQTLAPSTWKAFLRAYETQRTSLGIPLSYQVAYVVVQRPINR
ncbi:malonyl-ACP O-methyltransferase BioC [Marinomonas sp. IMCC 4694]|uniref:malonyl-ACP O-methyltransferase BioC n=1 Tax=Marinomonas sp. IMCC 4694 TaxID=2605432 RepID=UPI0011E7EB03|nr:malonyl-ACP O-methyltransferase BioC [Marinomonas sp. IMCC 4694]TYL48487.1 malonyl-ACP O-methyltransferase BioC [Marinomonas sp. IMCC 4694]